MKRFLSWALAMALVLMVAWTGYMTPVAAAELTGNYQQDTLSLIENLRATVTLSSDAPEKRAAQADARKSISDFSARYRRDGSLTKLSSFTTMRTALNSLAGHYTSYPNRPVPDKLKKRLEQEFKQVELALRREG